MPPELLARVERIEAVCRAHDTPIAQAALHFPLGHPAVSALVLGSVVPDEVRRNVDALARPVPPGLWPISNRKGCSPPTCRRRRSG
ncbi:MAG: aldo/keto reductase [Pseudomonadota bacterium]